MTDQQVTCVPKNNKPNMMIVASLQDALEEIKGGTYKDIITKLRLHPKGSNEANRIKNSLPAFAIGTFNNSVSNSNYVESSSEIFNGDIDNLDPNKISYYKSKLSDNPHIAYAFTSPSANGVKIGIKVSSIRNDAHLKQLVVLVEKLLLGIDPALQLDQACKNVSRLCYLSYDKNTYINLIHSAVLEGTAFDESLVLTDVVAVLPSVLNGELVIATAEDKETCIAKVTAMLDKSTAGEHHSNRIKVAKLAGGYVAGGLIDEAEIMDIIMQISDSLDRSGITPHKEIATIYSAFEIGLKTPIYSVSSDFENVDSSALAHLQSKFAMFSLSGSIGLLSNEQIHKAMSGSSDTEIQFYSRPSGTLMLHREIEKERLNIEQQRWWTNPKTHVYDAIAFSPIKQPATTLNYWQPHTVAPVAGDWTPIQEFLYEVIADSNTEVYEYLLNFLAHMIQKPEDKAGVVPVMLGGHGIGKGTLFLLIMRIWSKTSQEISEIERLVGRFNAGIERAYVLCLDEAVFAGDKKACDSFKNLITEPTIQIEQKNQPSRVIRSYHRFFAATNHDKFADTSTDDRRFLYLRPNEKYKQNFEYFTPLTDHIKGIHADGDIAVPAFVDFLLKREISNYNPRVRPHTKEMEVQKKLSLSGFDKFWGEALHAGGIAEEHFNDGWETGAFVPTNSIKAKYLAFDRNAEKYAPVTADFIGKRLATLSPSLTKGNPRRINGVQCRGVILGALEQARLEFDAYIGSDTEWDVLEEAEEDVF